jgi:hypothetical protein
MDTWNEFTTTVLEYTTNGSVDDYSATMVANFVKQGSESPREQVRLSRTIKDILSQFADSPLAGRKSSTRKSGLALLSDAQQAEWNDNVSMENVDGTITLTISADYITQYHKVFSGKKITVNGKKTPMTAWPTAEDCINARLLTEMQTQYVSAVKGDE